MDDSGQVTPDMDDRPPFEIRLFSDTGLFAPGFVSRWSFEFEPSEATGPTRMNMQQGGFEIVFLPQNEAVQ